MFNFKKLGKFKIIIGCTVLVLILLRAYSVSQVNKSIPLSNEPVAAQMQSCQQSSCPIKSLDNLFIIDAFQGGMAEIEVGKKALQQSTNPKIQKFAQMMIEQHTEAHEKLLQLLSNKKIAPPTTIGFKYETIDGYLTTLSGTSFDELYMNEMGVNRHFDAMATFQREIALGKDPDFKNFATTSLETARNHFQMAVTITGYTLFGENK